MTKESFLEYATLKIEQRKIEERLEELNAPLLAEMLEQGEDTKVNLDGLGYFIVMQTKDWTFPKNVVDLEAEFKKAKETSKQVGEATSVAKPSLRFYVQKASLGVQ